MPAMDADVVIADTRRWLDRAVVGLNLCPFAKSVITRDQVREHIKASGTALVDVRSPQEYSGERTHMPEYPQEGTLRGGHIPTAASIPWAQAVNADSTFKSLEDLQALYGGKGITPDKDVIAYCRIGERSSHTWFVLTYLLGYLLLRRPLATLREWCGG